MVRHWGLFAWGWLVVTHASLSVSAAVVDSFRIKGPVGNRVNIVFLGDGYQATEMDLYRQHTKTMLQHMFDEGEEPFARYTNFFNAHRIEVLSSQSGADDPSEMIYRDTALDATYDCASISRLICIDQFRAQKIMDAALAPLQIRDDMRIASVNDTQYGGSGGSVAVYAGGNRASAEIALHELGHSFSGLADEYGGNASKYTGPEPVEINVTTNPAGSEWSRWLGYDQPGVGLIGAYEGGRYYDQGIYRPSLNSKMRSLGQPFDAVSREKIILDIYQLVDPLDAWSDNSAPLTDPPSLQVAPIDPNVIRVDWLVDGTVVSQGLTLDIMGAHLSPGHHEIVAHAYDPTDWVRMNRSELQQSIDWSVEITSPRGDLNEDGSIDAADAGILFAEWGLTGSNLADLSDDFLVDAADASVLFAHWTGDGAVAVPEPASLLPIGWIVLVYRGRNMRRGNLAVGR